jgi:hypothetical protein
MFTLPSRIAGVFMLCVHSHGRLFLAGGSGKTVLALYKADRTTLIGPLINNMVIDLAKTLSVNIKVSAKCLQKASAKCLQKLRISSVAFSLDDKLLATDSTAPYWMFGDKDGSWTPTVGNHTIKAEAYRRNNGKGRKILARTTSGMAMDSRTKSPMDAAPSKAPVATPVKAPLALAPVAAPMVAPAVAPMVAPVAAPTLVLAPVAIPVMSPVAPSVMSPVTAPVTAPIVATAPAAAHVPATSPIQTTAPATAPVLAKAPTKAPTKIPTKAPISNCDRSTVAYVNCITQSNRVIMLNGTTAEDKALQWLVINDTLSLLPNSDANRTRLRQRFALLTFGFQRRSASVVLQAYTWNLSAATNECDWYTDKNFGFQCQNELVTNIRASGVTGTIPPDLCWLTGLKGVDIVRGGIPDAMGGTLPSMMGWWTNLTSFSIFNNFVEGSIPSSIGNLTAMTKVNLGFNNLNGTIPWSVGSWALIIYVQLAVNKLSGTIPSSIGAWKAANFVSVASNLLSGTIPSTVAAWTALDNGYFFSNRLNGSMPAFGGYFCPKKGNGTDLLADCSNITGQTKVTCVCCTVCS